MTSVAQSNNPNPLITGIIILIVLIWILIAGCGGEDAPTMTHEEHMEQINERVKLKFHQDSIDKGLINP